MIVATPLPLSLRHFLRQNGGKSGNLRRTAVHADHAAGDAFAPKLVIMQRHKKDVSPRSRVTANALRPNLPRPVCPLPQRFRGVPASQRLARLGHNGVRGPLQGRLHDG